MKLGSPRCPGYRPQMLYWNSQAEGLEAFLQLVYLQILGKSTSPFKKKEKQFNPNLFSHRKEIQGIKPISSHK